MKHKGSIVKTVFGTIDTIISTTENIHRNIAGITMKNRIRDRENNASVYDTVKSASGKVEEIVLSSFKR